MWKPMSDLCGGVPEGLSEAAAWASNIREIAIALVAVNTVAELAWLRVRQLWALLSRVWRVQRRRPEPVYASFKVSAGPPTVTITPIVIVPPTDAR